MTTTCFGYCWTVTRLQEYSALILYAKMLSLPTTPTSCAILSFKPQMASSQVVYWNMHHAGKCRCLSGV